MFITLFLFLLECFKQKGTRSVLLILYICRNIFELSFIRFRAFLLIFVAIHRFLKSQEGGLLGNYLEQRRLLYYSVLEIWTISLFRNNGNKRSCSAVYANIWYWAWGVVVHYLNSGSPEPQVR